MVQQEKAAEVIGTLRAQQLQTEKERTRYSDELRALKSVQPSENATVRKLEEVQKQLLAEIGRGRDHRLDIDLNTRNGSEHEVTLLQRENAALLERLKLVAEANGSGAIVQQVCDCSKCLS
jgi:hypothetical protein